MDQDPNTAGIQDKTYVDDADFISQVDLSQWENSIFCGSCHAGGSNVERDRNDVRLSIRALTDQDINAWTSYVKENYDPQTGVAVDAQGNTLHTVERAPWIYPYYTDNEDPATAQTAPNGYGRLGMPGVAVDKQLMMPNVREMDCLYCHLDGYNNMNNSVMTYMGAHNAAPMAGSGLMDMQQGSPTYQGYNSAMVDTIDMGANGTGVVLNAATMSKIQGNPSEQNCRQCHAPTNLADLPDMMRDFLSSAPMIYTGSSKSFTGLEMPAFDFNAPFGVAWDQTPGMDPAYGTSPVINMLTMMQDPAGFIPSIGYPGAMGQTAYNITALVNAGDIGGGNPAGTGPLYYQAPLDPAQPNGYQDQNALKNSVVPFPRAEWFKRGDMWGNSSLDVHNSFGCAGCHLDTNTAKKDGADAGIIDAAMAGKTLNGKSQCDPGRGYDYLSGVEEGHVDSTNPNEYVYSKDTVKRCVDCHVTGVNSDGLAIDTFGAPNPDSKHDAAGLTANITQAVRAAGTPGNITEEIFAGNHLDVVDCTVCHMMKEQMVVRALDSTSGHRYPNMLGFKEELGMMGMFSDPYNMGAADDSNRKKWVPLFLWQRNGSTIKTLADGSPNPEYRRKIYATNPITAVLWNNVGGTVDANGDGVNGRHAAPNLTYYDPWISRDMKAGLNFGPSGFAPIPIGFGGPGDAPEEGGGQYQSAYDANGLFTGAWTYVGAYGGNIAFSTPEEISSYKTFRTNQGGKSWADTELGFLAGPFKVTHGVRSVNQFALGKDGCTDCHGAPEFFGGGFNMTGTAIRTVAGKNIFKASEAPLEIMEVVGLSHDIETAAEVASKLTGASAVREVHFDEYVDWDPATKTWGPDLDDSQDYKRVTDLSRAKAMYPDEQAYTAADGTVYPDRASWVAYLNGITSIDDYVAAPVAAIDVSVPATAVVGTPISLVADESVNTVGVVNYSWISDDAAGEVLEGSTVSKTFNSVGTWTVTLKVTNANGVEDQVSKQIQVTAPAPDTVFSATDNGPGQPSILSISNMPAHTRLYILWGDGGRQWVTDAQGDNSNLDVEHTFATYSKYDKGAYYEFKVYVMVYNGSSRVETEVDTVRIYK